MGNAIGFLCGKCCKPTKDDVDYVSVEPLGISAITASVSALALAHDLFNFDNTSQVPEGLSKYVGSSTKAQANWYRKLSEAWKQTKPPPKTPEEAAMLVIQALARNQKADVEVLLAFYGLALPDTLVELVELSTGVPTSLPEGVKFEMETLPVDARSVADGDGMTVYVSTADSRKSSCVPRKYRIRLRGIDAPENAMPYGKEAKEALVKIIQGKCLRVHVYGKDQFRRYVADVYCNGRFVQELMLKKGLAWHYIKYDKRQEFARWEQQARAKRIGLWASSNPEKPWEWRRDQREGR